VCPQAASFCFATVKDDLQVEQRRASARRTDGITFGMAAANRGVPISYMPYS
jgi:hypothetical protein